MTRSSYRAWCGVIGRVLPKPAALMREALSETLPVRIATGEIRAYLPVSSDEGMAAGSGTSLTPPLAMLPNLVLSCLSGHSETLLFSNPLMSPFDSEVCHECEICWRFHGILKVILEMAFLAHCTQIRKLNRISMTIISKVAWKCIWCCGQVQHAWWLPTELADGGILCSVAWKRGQDSHATVFSIWSRS